MNQKQDIKQPLVAIRCMTYNHEKYIEDALKGFVMQETNFPFVAIVVDDASTDKEPEVLWNFVNNELDITIAQKDETEDYVRVVAPHKTNHNCTFVILFLKYNHYCKKDKLPYFKEWQDSAKYIAMCEGDDYWTDPYKLQKQVDYLESHPDCGLVYTKCKKYIQEKQIYEKMYVTKMTLDQLLFYNRIVTLTVCFKRELYDLYRKEIPYDVTIQKGWRMGDYPLWIYIASKTKLYFLPEYTGVYRVLINSASHFSDFQKQVDFTIESLRIKTYFAKFLKLEHNIQNIAKRDFNEIIKESLIHNKNFKFDIIGFYHEYKFKNPSFLIKFILSKVKVGRNLLKKIY